MGVCCPGLRVSECKSAGVYECQGVGEAGRPHGGDKGGVDLKLVEGNDGGRSRDWFESVWMCLCVYGCVYCVYVCMDVFSVFVCVWMCSLCLCAYGCVYCVCVSVDVFIMGVWMRACECLSM